MLVITKHSEAPWRKPEWSEIRIDGVIDEYFGLIADYQKMGQLEKLEKKIAFLADIVSLMLGAIPPNESINDYLIAALNDYAYIHSKYYRKETEENQ